MIHLSETNKISFKLGLGRATNSKAEPSTLWATLKIAKDNQIDKLNIYGDSKTVIEWATRKEQHKSSTPKESVKSYTFLTALI